MNCSQQISILNEMGISCWALAHPERLDGYQAASFTLPITCKLLLVSPYKPKQIEVVMLERVLKSMTLELVDCLHIEPSVLNRLENSTLPQWVWFVGCGEEQANYQQIIQSKQQVAGSPPIKILHTPFLSQIDGNNQQRKALWQQICSYD